MARRLSRLGNVDAVARGIVSQVAGMLEAERVSLALFRQSDGCLTIAAAHGYSASEMENIRIMPGDWVIGHVYSTKRPVVVRDVRTLGAPHGDRYRSFSFAAVPIVSGNETIGVLSVTDKRGQLPFDRQDLLALRAIGMWSGIALSSARIESEAARLAYAATIDSLTGLLNRPSFDSRLHQEVERAKREDGSLAVLIADLDNFKSINDRRGHQAGDAVLATVGSVIRSAVRVFDVCARYGGDEFAIVMPNSDRGSAVACAERIRRRLAESNDADPDQPRLTMSIGVAVFAQGDSAPDLIVRADRCMYDAKAQGKNLVLAQSVDRVDPPAPAATPAVVEALAVDQPPLTELPYVLVADAREDRASFCRECVSGLQRGLLIARDGEQAMQAIARFGPPALLIADLALPIKDGFTLIEAVRRDERRRPQIIAWAASREMREYAAARLNRMDVHVIGDAASPQTIRSAISRALDAGGPPEVAAADETSDAQDDLQSMMANLVHRAREVSGMPGAAVYMRRSGDARFTATFAWSADELMPHSPVHLPGAFDSITKTGQEMIVRDVTSELWARLEDTVDGVRGLAGVPIVADREILGAICVFDTRPLRLDERSMASLRKLGEVTFGKPAVLADSAPAGFRDRATDRAVPAGDEAVRRLDVVDWPPSLLERSGGEFAVARELARARREGHQLSVILFDLTPASGVEAASGDESLETVSETLLRAIRQSDLPIRWSGRELLVVLPGLADQQARSVAERVRAALHAGSRHRLAISGGVAELKSDERFGDVVERARQRVAMARGRGHNRVF